MSNVVSKEVVKITKFNKLNKKVNNLDNKIPDVTTFIHINQCNIDKQGKEREREREKKKKILIQKYLLVV